MILDPLLDQEADQGHPLPLLHAEGMVPVLEGAGRRQRSRGVDGEDRHPVPQGDQVLRHLAHVDAAAARRRLPVLQ